MCHKTVDYYNSHILEFVSNFYETQKICDKAVDTYPSGIQFVPECYKTQKMCDKTVDTCPFVFDSVHD